MPEVAISRLADAQVADTKYEATHIEVAELDSDIASDSGSVNSKSEDASSNGTRRSSLASRTSTLDLNASHLISSPYPDFENQLKLEGLDTPHQLFAFALTTLRPVRVDYATAPYLESFNWSEVFSFLRALCERTGHEWQETSFYTVIFRSTLLEGIDREELGRLDQKSHEEACASGGLLKYWFGSCDDQRRNLATCLWRSHDDAVAGGAGPEHKKARMAARTMYKQISFHTHQLVVEDGAQTWRLESFR